MSRGIGRIVDQRLRIYRLGWTVAFAALLAVTYPMWLGPAGVVASSYPAIPLLAAAAPYSGLLTTVGWLSILVGLMLQWFRGERPQRLALLFVSFGLLVSFISDQHHLQAWAYQFFLVALLMLCGDGNSERTVRRLRWLVASVYIFSAISKWDASFVNNLGPQMLAVLMEPLGLSLEAIPDGMQHWLTLLLPTFEFLIGIGLLFGRYRRVTVGSAVLMHLLLVGVVGPLGWGHQWGVSVWNVFFIFQAVVLFWPSQQVSSEESEMSGGPARIQWKVADVVLAFAIVFPLTEPLDVCDHWLAWELYAPRTSRVQVYVASADAAQLPEDVSQYLKKDEQGWRELDLAKWSLNSRQAPVYPEDRYQLGLGLSLDRWLSGDRSVRFLWRGAANRVTGIRDQEWLRGFDEARQFAGRFYWNAKASR